MPTQLELDFKQASPYLDTLLDGEKLSKTANYANYFLSPCPYQIQHAFIKIEGEVYALGDFIGKGAFGSVKNAYDSEGYHIVIKTEVFDSKFETYPTFCSRIETENKHLIDLGFGYGYAIRKRIGKQSSPLIRYKAYSAMAHQGPSLVDYLYDNSAYLSDRERLQLAISATRAVHDYHTGKASKTQTPYAHLDIKPQNMTVFETPLGKKVIKLIDVALCQRSPNAQIAKFDGGTPLYLPATYLRQQKKQLDILALKRTIFLSNTYYILKGLKVNRNRRSDTWILTDKIMDEKKLRPFFKEQPNHWALLDTSQTANYLGAILVLAYYDLSKHYHLVKNHNADEVLALFDKGLGKEAFEKALLDAHAKTHLPPLVPLQRYVIKPEPKVLKKKITPNPPRQPRVRPASNLRHAAPIVRLAPIKHSVRAPQEIKARAAMKTKALSLEVLLNAKSDNTEASHLAVQNFLSLLEKVKTLPRTPFMNPFGRTNQEKLLDITRLDDFVESLKQTLITCLSDKSTEEDLSQLKERLDKPFEQVKAIRHHSQEWPSLRDKLDHALNNMMRYIKLERLHKDTQKEKSPEPLEHKKTVFLSPLKAPKHPHLKGASDHVEKTLKAESATPTMTEEALINALFKINMTHLSWKIKKSAAFRLLVIENIHNVKSLRTIAQFFDIVDEMRQATTKQCGDRHIQPFFRTLEHSLLDYAKASHKNTKTADNLKKALESAFHDFAAFSKQTPRWAPMKVQFNHALERLIEIGRNQKTLSPEAPTFFAKKPSQPPKERLRPIRAKDREIIVLPLI